MAAIVVLCAGCDLGGSSGGSSDGSSDGGSGVSYGNSYDPLISTGDPVFDTKGDGLPPYGGFPDDGDFGETVPVASTPEPATLTLLGLGVAGLALRYRRRRSK